MTIAVTVLVQGIADTRLPMAPVTIASAGAEIRGGPPTILGAFDEAALEVGLKLRDADPAIRLGVVVIDSAGNEALARAVASHRPDGMLHVDARALARWDAVATASLCVWAIARSDGTDLVLVGREFGDLDDGAVPAAIAERLGWRFFALAQQIRVDGRHAEVLRERGEDRVWTRLGLPLVASVTNDRSNRIRHPLLKNVMAAKRMTLPRATAPAECAHGDLLPLAVGEPPAGAPAHGAARRLLGGTIDQQADALGKYLWELRGAA